MRPFLYLVTALVVMTMAFWAYRENYRTQTSLDVMSDVQREIANLREELGVLRAEWAYLNRPDRLRELVDINFARIKLVPFTSDQFIDLGNIAYPPPPISTPPRRPEGFVPPGGAITEDDAPQDQFQTEQSP